MKRLILLTGPARSGKDTAAEMLMELAPFRRYAMADPIRAMLKAGGIIKDSDLLCKEKNLKHVGASPRKLMQTLGTEWGREMIDADLWVSLMIRRLQEDMPKFAVITDIRFDNEIELISQQFNCNVWHIRKPKNDPVAPHRSEDGVTFLSDHKMIVNAGSSLSDFRLAVTTLYNTTK